MASVLATRARHVLAALLGVAAVAWTVPFGCAQGTTSCQLNSDCVVGYCLNGSCAKNCVDASRDCPAGYECDQNAECVLPTGSGGSSASSATSSNSSNSSTSSVASTSTSSASSSSTMNGSSSSSSPSSSSTTVSSTVTTTGSSSSTVASSSSSSTGGTMNLTELDLCVADTDCVSPLICRTMVVGGPKRCTPECTSNAACAAGTVCEMVGGTTYCAGDDTGRACTGSADCNFGCLGSEYCTKECGTGADCPNGYGCMELGNTPPRICVRAEAPCDTSDTTACVGPAFCDVSANLVVGGCTTLCTTATDCPVRAAGFQTWTCDTAAGGLCRRPPDVSGPLQNGATPAQYACNASSNVVNVCNDDQHIDFGAFDIPSPPSVSCSATTTTSGTSTDSCVDSCRYEGGCPYGAMCTALGSVGTNSRIGLCLLTGTGEVGTSCTSNSECVFGYCPSALGKCSRDCTADGICPNGTTCTAAGGPAVEGAPFRRCE